MELEKKNYGFSDFTLSDKIWFYDPIKNDEEMK